MIGDALDLARRSVALPRFLRRPLDLPTATEAVGAGVKGREAAFLQVLEHLVFGVETSPLRRLLTWAGCTLGDLQNLVAAEGIEGALARLRAAGIFVTADEMRGRVPLRRSGLEMLLAPGDFDNPRLRGGVAGATSGSTGRRVPVRYDWPFLASEAAGELLLLESHGLREAPLSFWMPGPPGIAGLHNLLVHAKLGHPPERWFSTSPPPRLSEGLAFWVDRGWRAGRRLLPRLGPAPEWVPAERADEVARCLARSAAPAVLKCFASSALRVASAAAGLDLSRSVVFAGGEPLTSARREFLARSGLRVYARYAATETGFIAGACPFGEDGGEMHLYSDRLALIGPEPGGTRAAPFAFTILSLAAPKVLLNAELGDQGLIRQRSCQCALGRAGLDWHVRDVHSPSKIAAEGVKLGELDFARLVEEAARDLGGNPDELQIWLGAGSAKDDGASRITIVLAPGAPLDPARLERRLRERLPELSGGSLAAKLWFEGGALAIERRPLRLGPGQKMQRVVHLDRTLGQEGGPSDAL